MGEIRSKRCEGVEITWVLDWTANACGLSSVRVVCVWQGTDSGSYRYGNGLLSREVFESLDARLQEALS